MTDRSPPVALAVVAHPDDIEFLFSGTLLLLRNAGCSIHMWNVADGSCGSKSYSAGEIVDIRLHEAGRSAAIAGAVLHRPLFPDMGIFYDRPSLSRVASALRTIRPQIILTHSPDDYMEDHQNVCRLITTAAFCREMPNFSTTPDTEPFSGPVRLYHAPPHGLVDGLCRPFQPDFLVDVKSVIETKSRMLSCHESQQGWLQGTQGMGTLNEEMIRFCREMASWGENLQFAESWRQHSHLGFCERNFEPLQDLLSSSVSRPTSLPTLKYA